MNANNPEVRCEPEWVVAAIAPWALSPHPNFSKQRVNAPEALALVAEFRFFRERDRFEVSARAEWESDLVNAAAASLIDKTQESAAALLWGLAGRDDLPLGARAAAALFASLAYAEMDLPDLAAEKLEALLAVSNAHLDSSSRLCLAAVNQQRLLRLFDATRFDAAREALTFTKDLLPERRQAGYERFAVSEGISWTASDVQHDVASTMVAYAREASSLLEGLDGETWVQVVRRRRGWMDYRLRVAALERDSKIVRDDFESKFESTSGTRHFARATAAESGYAALLVSELGGSPYAAPNAREELGRILLLQNEIDAHSASEALRLLRQAGAPKPLRAALIWLRSEGPASALVTAVGSVITRVERLGCASESDLLILEFAGGFLKEAEAERALHATTAAIDTESLGSRARWATLDKVVRAIRRITEDTGEVTAALQIALGIADYADVAQEPTASTLADFLDSVDWDQVSPELRDQWTEWAENIPTNADSNETEVLRSTVLEAAAGRLAAIPEPNNIDRAAYLADNGLGSGQSDDLVLESSAFLVNALSQEAAFARQGSASFGGLSTANVAVAFALKFADEQVWSAVVEHLIDPMVFRSLKRSALDRLTHFSASVPKYVRERLAAGTEQILASRAQGGWAEDEDPVFPSALRLGGTLRSIEQDSAVDAIITMSAGSAGSRLEGARSVPYVVGPGDATWAHALLLQMSRDENPLVRAETGASLARTLHLESSLSRAVSRRVEEFITLDGVRIPLFTIRGLLEAAEQNGLDLRVFAEALRAANTSRSPSMVKKAALDALKVIPGGAISGKP